MENELKEIIEINKTKLLHLAEYFELNNIDPSSAICICLYFVANMVLDKESLINAQKFLNDTWEMNENEKR